MYMEKLLLTSYNNIESNAQCCRISLSSSPLRIFIVIFLILFIFDCITISKHTVLLAKVYGRQMRPLQVFNVVNFLLKATAFLAKDLTKH